MKDFFEQFFGVMLFAIVLAWVAFVTIAPLWIYTMELQVFQKNDIILDRSVNALRAEVNLLKTTKRDK